MGDVHKRASGLIVQLLRQHRLSWEEAASAHAILATPDVDVEALTVHLQERADGPPVEITVNPHLMDVSEYGLVWNREKARLKAQRQTAREHGCPTHGVACPLLTEEDR
jgi:hypothetical protein